MAKTLNNKRKVIAANRATMERLTGLVTAITAEIGLDEDRMAKRIHAATGNNNEYGAINGMINLVANIAAWPAEAGDGASVATNRQILESKFNLDLLLLDDIKSFKGYHTFVSDDTLEIIAGVPPQYEDYTDYCTIFLEDLADRELAKSLNKPVAKLTAKDRAGMITSAKATITQEKWEALEAKAIDRAGEEQETKKIKLAEHKATIAKLSVQ